MAGKIVRRRSAAVLALSAVFVGAAAVPFVARHEVSQRWREWSRRDSHRYPDYETQIRLQTERNHIEVYDMRRHPALIHSFNVEGLRDVTVKYTRPTSSPFDIFDLRSGGASEAGPVLLHLPVDPAHETQVDARWQNLYEVESGSQLNMISGSVVRCQRTGFTSGTASLFDASTVPASSPSTPVRVIVRPDMTSPLWDWDRRVAMQGSNGRYYLSAYHASGIPAKDLAAAIVRNPPRD